MKCKPFIFVVSFFQECTLFFRSCLVLQPCISYFLLSVFKTPKWPSDVRMDRLNPRSKMISLIYSPHRSFSSLKPSFETLADFTSSRFHIIFLNFSADKSCRCRMDVRDGKAPARAKSSPLRLVHRHIFFTELVEKYINVGFTLELCFTLSSISSSTFLFGSSTRHFL